MLIIILPQAFKHFDSHLSMKSHRLGEALRVIIRFLYLKFRLIFINLEIFFCSFNEVRIESNLFEEIVKQRFD